MPYDLASPLMGIFSKHVSRDEWIRCGTRGYSAINKNEILSFVTTWMDLEGIMLSKISQSDKYSMMSLYMENENQNKGINITKQ